jgi:hypothetical protein
MSSRTKYYRVKVYVGPVHVEHYTAEARRAGLTDCFGGTEHVYGTAETLPLETETDRLVFRQRVAALVYGTPMATGWRDVDIIGPR